MGAELHEWAASRSPILLPSSNTSRSAGSEQTPEDGGMHLNYHAYFKAIDLQRELLRDAAEELGQLPMRSSWVPEQPMTRYVIEGLERSISA
jgi:hypothetical protein